MIIRIDVSGDVPIYVQLRNEIVKGIGRGELSEGECLPTVRQLAADLGVNSMTVSKAYQTLKAEGFIETDRRRGAVVRAGVQSGAQPDERYREKLEGELELLSAEAKIKGFGREEFIHLCSTAFAGMGKAFWNLFFLSGSPQAAMNGTRMPPSNSDPFLPLRGADEPYSRAGPSGASEPLSPRKIISVFPAMPSFCK